MSRPAQPRPVVAGIVALLAAGLIFAVVVGWGAREEARAPAVPPPAVEPAPAEPAPAAEEPPGGTSLNPVPGAGPDPLPAAPLRVPVAGVRPDELEDNYLAMRGDTPHHAIDIMAPKGTPVVAAAGGVVKKLFTSKKGGLTVSQFSESEELAYYYAHLDRYAPGLREGMYLERGDPVGTVGTTGNVGPDSPHLHFAVTVLGPEKRWWEGTPINPYPLLTGAGREVDEVAKPSAR